MDGVSGTLSRATAVLGFVLTLGLPVSAHAAEIAVEGVALDRARLEALLRLELGEDTQDVRVRISPAADGATRVVASRVGQAANEGNMKLSGEPERALALLVAELVRAGSEAALVPTAKTTDRPIGRAVPARGHGDAPRGPSERRDESSPNNFALAVTMGVRGFPRGGAALFTPRVEGAIVLGRLRVGALARYGYAGESDRLGDVRSDLVCGGAALTVRVIRVGAVDLAFGPRGEIGWLGGAGSGTGGASSSTVATAFALEAELAIRIGTVALLTTIEGGAARGMRLYADEREVLAVSGLFYGAASGLAF